MTTLTHRTVYYPSLPQQQGLNGVFAWLGRQLGALISKVGSWLADKIEAFSFGMINAGLVKKGFNWIAEKAVKYISAGDGLLGKLDQDVTAAELAWIESFIETKLKPYITQLLTELKAAEVATDYSAKLAGFNTVRNKINAINAYYDIDRSNTALSENARRQFQYFVYEMLRPMFEGIDDAVLQLPVATEAVEVNFAISQYSFTPLFATPSKANDLVIKDINYKLLNAPALPQPTKPVATAPVKGSLFDTLINKNPASVGVADTSVKTPPLATTPIAATPPTTTTTGTTKETDTGGTTPAPTTGRSNTVLLVGGLIGVILGYKLLSLGDKPKKSKKQK